MTESAVCVLASPESCLNVGRHADYLLAYQIIHGLCRLFSTISKRLPVFLIQPGPILVVQLKRSDSVKELSEFVDLATAYEEAGADALCIPMDSDDTPSGLKDVYSTSRAVKIPVVAQDWFIHPLQVDLAISVVHASHQPHKLKHLVQICDNSGRQMWFFSQVF